MNTQLMEQDEHKSLCELNPPPLLCLTVAKRKSGGGSNSANKLTSFFELRKFGTHWR